MAQQDTRLQAFCPSTGVLDHTVALRVLRIVCSVSAPDSMLLDVHIQEYTKHLPSNLNVLSDGIWGAFEGMVGRFLEGDLKAFEG